MFVQKHSACILIFNPDNYEQVLCVSRKGNYSMIGLPGGKIEDKETIINGLVREVKEEIGFDLNTKKLEFVYQNYDTDHLVSTYLYNDPEGTYKLKEAYINSENSRVSFENLSKLTSPKTSPFSDYNLNLILNLNHLDFLSILKK